MLGGIFFTLLRLVELLTIIPTVGMLSYFVDGYVKADRLTPNYILVLFIVSTLAGVWALVTLFKRDSVRRNAAFVAFIDLCFMGAFIAGAYYIRQVTEVDCINVSGGPSASASSYNNGVTFSIDFRPFGVQADKTCSMFKACFAFAIMNCIFFTASSLIALLLHRRERAVVVEKSYRRSSHGSRRGHHRRSSSHGSRRNYYV